MDPQKRLYFQQCPYGGDPGHFKSFEDVFNHIRKDKNCVLMFPKGVQKSGGIQAVLGIVKKNPFFFWEILSKHLKDNTYRADIIPNAFSTIE